MLALAMGCALIRLLKGPSAQDRVLALDCMYLSGMLMMLVLGLLYGSKNYFEAALLLALFSFVGDRMTDAATTATAVLPLWLEIIVAVLVLAGAALALLGSIGLLRLPTFFERVHAPSIIATLGCWLIMHGTVLYFSVADSSLALHALLIAVFVAITVPIMSIFLMRAALFRARQGGRDVPPSLSQPNVGGNPEAKDS
eukprot:gene2233-2187_t